MKLNKIISLILVGFMLFSCEIETDVYENLPSDKFPENEGQLASITLNAYSGQSHLLDDGGWWLYAQEVSSDVLVFPQRGTDWEDGGKWRVLHRHTWTADDAAVGGMWGTLYSAIADCNQAIEYLGTDNEVTRIVKAELEVLRSFYYFLLLDNFGDVPYLDTFKDADAAPTRVKRADIYNKLVEVVTNAIPYLPDAKAVDNHKISKAMAWMLLSKLHLNAGIYRGDNVFEQADMDKVIEYTNNVISSGYSLATNRLAPFMVDNSECNENIYTIVGDENADGMRLIFRTLHTLMQEPYDLVSTPWNGCAVKPDFYTRLFAANDGFDDADDITSTNAETVDQRSNGFLRGEQFNSAGEPLQQDDDGKKINLIYTNAIEADILSDADDGTAKTRFSGYRIAKYEIEIGGNFVMNNDFPVYRLADAYLMRAEATLRGGTGSDSNADDDLNEIRNAAGLDDVTATLDEILDERGRELFLEGHRRTDLIRFGKFADRDWWLGAPESGAGVERLIFPVPQSQVDANPNLSKDPVSL